MKKTIYTLIALLLPLLGINAQSTHWSLNENNWPDETPIYCNLVSELSTVGINMNDYEVAAFIDDEVRGIGVYHRDNSGVYFFVRVKGDGDDIGKEIIFKAFNRYTGVEYILTAKEEPLPITYTGNMAAEGEPGIVSNLRHLYLTPVTAMRLPSSITVYKGESVDLLDYLTILPDGASVPANLTWSVGNSGAWISVEGNTLTGLQTTSANGVSLGAYSGNPTAGSNEAIHATTTVFVKERIDITINTDPIIVSVGDEKGLTSQLTSCFSVTPEGSQPRITYDVVDPTIVKQMETHVGFLPLKPGETIVKINAWYEDGTMATNKGVTVIVRAAIEELALSKEEISCNVGDDILPWLNSLVQVLPADAPDKTVNWGLGNQYDSGIVLFSDGAITAQKEGDVTLTATSNADPTKTATITVTVWDPVKSLDFAQESITVYYYGTSKSIMNDIRAVAVGGPNTTSRIETTITATSDNSSVVNVAGRGHFYEPPAYAKIEPGLQINATAEGPGTAHVTVTFTWEDFMKEFTDPNATTRMVTVSKTLTVNVVGLSIKEGYETITVKKNDAATLNQKLSEAVQVTPEGATANVLWQTGDESIVARQIDASGLYYFNPIAVGQTTMLASVPELTVGGPAQTTSEGVTLIVNVVAGVEEINFSNLNQLDCLVGDELNDALTAVTNVLPAEAANKAITWSISGQSQDPTVLNINDGGAITAMKEGVAILQATSIDNPQVSNLLMVVVHNYVKDVTIVSDPLSVQLIGESTDVSEQMKGNLTFTPQNTANSLTNIYNNSLSITSSNADVLTISNVSYNTASDGVVTDGLSLTATALTAGEATVTVTFNYPDYLKQYTDPNSNHIVTVTKTFVVNVSQDLFSIETSELVFGEPSTIYILKEGESTFDENKLKIVIKSTNQLPDAWTQTITKPGEREDNQVTYSVKPQVPGTVNIEVWYNNILNNTGEADVIMPFSLTEGWQWRTLNYGFVDGSEMMESIFEGNNLVEIRSQQELMYNDPVYGYFGYLADWGLDQGTCYKIKVRANSDTHYFDNGDLMTEGSQWSLNTGWTWVGNPYLYRRYLSNIFINTTDLSEGDRIVSKNGGFAEYNGTEWEGDLQIMQPGEGYLYYTSNAGRSVSLNGEFQWNAKDDDAVDPANPDDSNNDDSQGAKRMTTSVMQSPWNYDASMWRDNMSIVAAGNGLEGCIVGAFVGDECRGQGRLVNGNFFITVHGQGGETVGFRLFNTSNGDIYPIAETLPFSIMAGSLREPVQLTIGQQTTAIRNVGSQTDEHTTIWSLDGTRRESLQRGVNIVRDSRGNTKKMVTK